jgi:hypothetical protein
MIVYSIFPSSYRPPPPHPRDFSRFVFLVLSPVCACTFVNSTANMSLYNDRIQFVVFDLELFHLIWETVVCISYFKLIMCWLSYE